LNVETGVKMVKVDGALASKVPPLPTESPSLNGVLTALIAPEN
jgi:hypothetical protein